MLLISCPNCGPRNETEFHCGGESHITRPALDCSDHEWADYLYFRSNPKGLTFERWRHSYGCGRWFNLVRDTRTHAIRTVYSMTEPKPRVEGSP
jgi:sarcosine oxidase, subunit delta